MNETRLDRDALLFFSSIFPTRTMTFFQKVLKCLEEACRMKQRRTDPTDTLISYRMHAVKIDVG